MGATRDNAFALHLMTSTAGPWRAALPKNLDRLTLWLDAPRTFAMALVLQYLLGDSAQPSPGCISRKKKIAVISLGEVELLGNGASDEITTGIP